MGAKSNFFTSRGNNYSRLIWKNVIIRERNLIQQHYDFLKCKIGKDNLICEGVFQPTTLSQKYTYEVIYDGQSSPKVYIKNPEIEYHDDIHMFPKDNSLCLYHPESDDFHWNAFKHNLHLTIIPWTQEWFIFYELYLITGKWEHPFHPHLNKTV